MKKTAKKALSLLLCMVLCLSLLPVTALAEEAELAVAELQETKEAPAGAEAEETAAPEKPVEEPAVEAAAEPEETAAGDENVAIDESNFPDAAFRSYISENFDDDSDGVLSPGEIAGVKNILCSGLGLTSLEGIGFFTELMNLNCSSNQLTELDLSNNTALIILNCDDNQLTELDLSNIAALEYLYCSSNQLTELDVSNNPTLTYLECDSNQLKTLNISGCTALKSLSCLWNQLTTLDVSSCTALESLDCWYNQLTELNISGCTALVDLDCSDNELTALDVSGCTALEYLVCVNNPIPELDVSGLTALEYLKCGSHQLMELDVSGCTALKSLSCNFSGLTALDVSDLTALEYLSCMYNCLPALDLSNNTNLQSVDCTGQKATVPGFTQSGDKYIVDLSALVGTENTGKITSVENGEYDQLTGIASFDAPCSFTYYYNTGRGDTLMDVTCEEEESTGAALTGTAISWDGNGNEVICLYSGMSEDEIKTDIAAGAVGAGYTAQCGEAVQNADGKRFDVAFSFSDVEAGEYILAIYKPGNYVLKTVNVTVSGDADLGGFELQLTGDIGGDGNVNTMDLIRLMKYISGAEVDMAEGAGDVNGDGKVNTMDLIRLMKIINGEDVERN